MKINRLFPKFVEVLPEQLNAGTLYISIEYRTAAHLCCCGCGKEVVTPLSPTDWKLTFDGVSVSLHPSIGNWSFECRSHYFVRGNKIQWAGSWTEDQVKLGRQKDREAKARPSAGKAVLTTNTAVPSKTMGLWKHIRGWFVRW